MTISEDQCAHIVDQIENGNRQDAAVLLVQLDVVDLVAFLDYWMALCGENFLYIRDKLDVLPLAEAHHDRRPHGRWIVRGEQIEYLIEVEGERTTLATRNPKDWLPVWGPPMFGEKR